MKAVGVIIVVIGAILFLMFGNGILTPHDTSKGTDFLIGEYAADAFFGIVAWL